MSNWPLFDLVVRTPLLELRPIREADMWELMDLADRGIHDPATMPFTIPWTDLPAPERHVSSAQFYWGSWANWSVDQWRLPMVVSTRVDGVAIGQQDLGATNFVEQREIVTGSWLGAPHQGAGFGTDMRHAVLHLAFAGLDAHAAISGAFWDNAASCGVSRKLGYQTVGEDTTDRRGVLDRCLNFRLDRDAWQRIRRDDITIDGLDSALSMFGL